MASIFRRNKNGKPHGKFLIRYKDEFDKWKTAPGYANRELTWRKASLLEHDVECRRRGIVDQFEEPKKVPLSEHLKSFRRHLLAKDDSETYVEHTIARIQAILDACGFQAIDDLSRFDATDRVNEYLTKRRRAKEKAINNQSCNHYLTALINFCRWAAKQRRMPASPIALMDKLETQTDEQRERRAIKSDQFAELIAAARNGEASHRLTGAKRAWLYLVAAYSGLRASELASLSPSSFQLDTDPPCVMVRASISKNGKPVDQPLRQDLVDMIRKWIGQHDTDQRLWPGRWYSRAAEMLRVDLKAAGIDYVTDDGVFDFHSLRVTYVTELVRSGAHPKIVQTLARHCTITLTMKHYAKLDHKETAAALAKLPAPPRIRSVVTMRTKRASN